MQRRKKSHDRRRIADREFPQLRATPNRDRERALRRLAARASGLKWSRRLIVLLLDELGEVDDLEGLIGNVRRLPPQRYPEAVALAVALRYSWRRDQFAWIARRIRALGPIRSAPSASGKKTGRQVAIRKLEQ